MTKKQLAIPSTLTLVALTASSLGFSGCGASSDGSDSNKPSPYAGIAVSAVAPDYSSSTLYYQGLSSGNPIGELKTLLSGESGDPWLKMLGDQLYLFNRSSTSSNFRTVSPKDGTASQQIRTEQAGTGDPHAAALLDSSRMLLAYYTASKLVVINPSDGSLKQSITADWDFGDDAAAVLRATAIYMPKNSKDEGIYVLHQGRKSDFSGYNNTQQLFILKDNGKELEVIDADPEKPKIQGIKLNIFNPQIVVASSNPNEPMIGGFCTIYDRSIDPCISGFEKVDLKARKSQIVYQHDIKVSAGNGNIAFDGTNKFFVAMAQTDASGNSKSLIQTFDVSNQSVEAYYEFSDQNYAAYALAFDQASSRLYAGEKSPSGTGLLTILNPNDRNTTPTKVEIPLVPSQIEFIP